MIRVVLADSHKLLHPGIHSILSSRSEIILIHATTCSNHLKQLCQEHTPDVVLIGLNADSKINYSTLFCIKETHPSIKTLVLLQKSDAAYLPQLISAGVVGGVLKSEDPNMLIDAINTVARGQKWFSPHLTSQLIISQKDVELTHRELYILNLVASGKTDKEIAQVLNKAERTIRYHLQKMGEKLGTSTRIETISKAFRQNLIH